MSRFLESIAIVEGDIQRLVWHQRRVNRTLQAFHNGATLDLYAAIRKHDVPKEGVVKCRVLYDGANSDVQFSNYAPRAIRTLKVIENNVIEYPYKFADRAEINRVFDEKGNADDILIVKNGRVTDSSIANIAFRRGEKWFTPRHPLLNGTMREYLLDNGTLAETDIMVNSLGSFDGFKLINAMLAFTSEEYPVSNIHF